MPQHHEETVSSKSVFEGRVFRVTVDEARLENGKIAPREVVHHSGGAAVLALNERAEVALVRQFRYAVGRQLIEIPAGKIEPGEAPGPAARRELGEEAGLAARHFVPFGSILPTCAYDTEVIHIFLATGLREVPCHPDADEFVSVFWLPLEKAVQMVMDGEITDAKSVSALLRAARLLEAGELEL